MCNHHFCHGRLGSAVNGLLLSLSLLLTAKSVVAASVLEQPVLSYQAHQRHWALPLGHGALVRINHSTLPLVLSVSVISANTVTLTLYSLDKPLQSIEDIFALAHPIGVLQLTGANCEALKPWGVTALSVAFSTSEPPFHQGEPPCLLNTIP